MSQCTGVDKIWSALYSSGALAEREVENKIGHAFSTFAVVVLALGHFAKLADCGFATIYLIYNEPHVEMCIRPHHKERDTL